MNRAERRAAARHERGCSFLRKASKKLVQGVAVADRRPDRTYLVLNMRAMKIEDLIPGYTYRPGVTLLEITMPATVDFAGFMLQLPLDLPAEFRAPTPENAQVAFAIAYSCDPEARAIINDMRARARPQHEVDASVGLPSERFGPIVLPGNRGMQ